MIKNLARSTDYICNESLFWKAQVVFAIMMHKLSPTEAKMLLWLYIYVLSIQVSRESYTIIPHEKSSCFLEEDRGPICLLASRCGKGGNKDEMWHINEAVEFFVWKMGLTNTKKRKTPTGRDNEITHGVTTNWASAKLWYHQIYIYRNWMGRAGEQKQSRPILRCLGRDNV